MVGGGVHFCCTFFLFYLLIVLFKHKQHKKAIAKLLLSTLCTICKQVYRSKALALRIDYGIITTEEPQKTDMTLYEIGAIILLAAAIHASFQLSVSMLTVMSGHALGRKRAHKRVLRLISSFVLGSMTMVTLTVSFLALLAQNLFPGSIPPLVWAAVSGLMIGVGVAVWAFYYRPRDTGTVLWIPRHMAKYLSGRARSTKLTPEAFGLGLSSVVGELLFGLAPMIAVALLLSRLEAPLQIAGLILYTLVASLPLFIITIVVGGGRTLARVQRWRERNKRFMQFIAGSALIILGAYIYVDLILAQAVGANI